MWSELVRAFPLQKWELKTRKDDNGQRDWAEGQGSRQCSGFPEGLSANGVTNSNRKAGAAGRFGGHRMRQLVEQAMEPQRRKTGLGAILRSAQPI